MSQARAECRPVNAEMRSIKTLDFVESDTQQWVFIFTGQKHPLKTAPLLAFRVLGRRDLSLYYQRRFCVLRPQYRPGSWYDHPSTLTPPSSISSCKDTFDPGVKNDYTDHPCLHLNQPRLRITITKTSAQMVLPSRAKADIVASAMKISSKDQLVSLNWRVQASSPGVSDVFSGNPRQPSGYGVKRMPHPGLTAL